MWRKSIIVGKFFSQNKKKWEMKIAPVYYQLCKSYSSFHRKKEKPRRRSGFFLKNSSFYGKFVKKIQLFVKNVN